MADTLQQTTPVAVDAPTGECVAALPPHLESTRQLIDRYRTGQASLHELAQECGMSDDGLRRRFKVFALVTPTVGYSDIVAEHFATYIVEADEKLEAAPSMTEVARAREQCKFTRMDYERKCPDKYGPKQEIKSDKTIRVVIQRDGNVQGSPQSTIIDTTASSTDR